jgi:hypothetical protein
MGSRIIGSIGKWDQIYPETKNRQTDIQIDRQTDRQTVLTIVQTCSKCKIHVVVSVGIEKEVVPRFGGQNNFT